MTPASAMRSAYDIEIALWRVRDRTEPDGAYQIVRYKDGYAEYDVVSSSFTKDVAYHEMGIRAKEAGHRAALRALAAMEPTEGMQRSYVTVGRSIGQDRAWANKDYAPTRSYILAAASEGETP